MKSWEIKKIDVGSVLKFYFLIGVVLGLLASVVILLTGASLKEMGIGAAMGEDGPLQFGAVSAGVVISSLAYGLLTGLVGAIGALIYNMFASITGGIVIRVNDSDC